VVPIPLRKNNTCWRMRVRRRTNTPERLDGWWPLQGNACDRCEYCEDEACVGGTVGTIAGIAVGIAMRSMVRGPGSTLVLPHLTRVANDVFNDAVFRAE